MIKILNIITFFAIIIIATSCVSTTKNNKDCYNMIVAKWNIENPIKTIKILVEKSLNDPSFCNYMQEMLPLDTNDERRFNLYTLFYNYPITPKKDIVEKMLNDKIPSIRVISLIYCEKFNLRGCFKNKIVAMSQNDKDEFVRKKAKLLVVKYKM